MATASRHTHWNLQDLLPGGLEDLEQILTDIERCVQEMEAFRPHLSDDLSVSEFLALFQRKERLNELTARAGAYAYLHYAEDTQNPEALSLQDRINQLLTEVDNRTLFFNLWFKDLSDEAARRYIDAAGELSYFLEAQRRFKPYTLSEIEEKIINLKDLNGIEGLVKV